LKITTPAGTPPLAAKNAASSAARTAVAPPASVSVDASPPSAGAAESGDAIMPA
jgi:hypothetical protein